MMKNANGKNIQTFPPKLQKKNAQKFTKSAEHAFCAVIHLILLNFQIILEIIIMSDLLNKIIRIENNKKFLFY